MGEEADTSGGESREAQVPSACPALAYENGDDGWPQEYAEAARRYRLAANLDCAAPEAATAQFHLVRLNQWGAGVEEDSTEAVRLFRLAAEWGYARDASVAQNKLGRLYQRAAQEGRPDAQHNLGVIFGTGRAVEKNISQRPPDCTDSPLTKTKLMPCAISAFSTKRATGSSRIAQKPLGFTNFLLPGTPQMPNGVEEDRAETARLDKLAAERSKVEVRHLCLKARRRNEGMEIFNLARPYREGRGAGGFSGTPPLGGSLPKK